MPSPSEYKGDFLFYLFFSFQMGKRKSLPLVCKASFAKYSYRFCVCQRCPEQFRRPFVTYALLCRWLLHIVISISKTLIFSQSTGKHTTSNRNNTQAFTLAFRIDFDLDAFKSNEDIGVSDGFDRVGPLTRSLKCPFVAKHTNTHTRRHHKAACFKACMLCRSSQQLPRLAHTYVVSSWLTAGC